MPTYDYACDHCGHSFEVFQSITAAPLTECPSCSRSGLRRLIGPGAGVIFRGSGFYETDYRSEAYRKAAEAERKAAGGDKPEKAEAAKAPAVESAAPKAEATPSGGGSAGSKAPSSPAAPRAAKTKKPSRRR